MPPRKLPPNDELFKMLRSGMTHQEIADESGDEPDGIPIRPRVLTKEEVLESVS